MRRVLQPALLILLGLLWLLPIYLVVTNASKPSSSFDYGEVWGPTTEFALLENLSQAWTSAGLGSSIATTLLYSTMSPALSVLIGAAAGFAIVALRLRYGFAWFIAIFAGTIFPFQMLLMPLFVGYAETGLYNNRLGMILIYTAISVPFAAFVMRNFFTGFARTVFEAAVVDGATTWRIFWRIYLPMATSALVAVFILQATMIWNDLLLGLVLTESQDVRPVMTALAGLQNDYGSAAPPTVLAGALLLSAPTIVLFLAAQRFFARGLSLGQFT